MTSIIGLENTFFERGSPDDIRAVAFQIKDGNVKLVPKQSSEDNFVITKEDITKCAKGGIDCYVYDQSDGNDIKVKAKRFLNRFFSKDYEKINQNIKNKKEEIANRRAALKEESEKLKQRRNTIFGKIKSPGKNNTLLEYFDPYLDLDTDIRNIEDDIDKGIEDLEYEEEEDDDNGSILNIAELSGLPKSRFSPSATSLSENDYLDGIKFEEEQDNLENKELDELIKLNGLFEEEDTLDSTIDSTIDPVKSNEELQKKIDEIKARLDAQLAKIDEISKNKIARLQAEEERVNQQVALKEKTLKELITKRQVQGDNNEGLQKQLNDAITAKKQFLDAEESKKIVLSELKKVFEERKKPTKSDIDKLKVLDDNASKEQKKMKEIRLRQLREAQTENFIKRQSEIINSRAERQKSRLALMNKYKKNQPTGLTEKTFKAFTDKETKNNKAIIDLENQNQNENLENFRYMLGSINDTITDFKVRSVLAGYGPEEFKGLLTKLDEMSDEEVKGYVKTLLQEWKPSPSGQTVKPISVPPPIEEDKGAEEVEDETPFVPYKQQRELRETPQLKQKPNTGGFNKKTARQFKRKFMRRFTKRKKY
jgi:hypothetical protein